MQRLSVKGRFWIDSGEHIFLGEGRAALLEAITACGSISKAAAQMGMSYKKAWNLVESMNALADQPLVVTQTGGSKGGGTRITEFGLHALQLHREVETLHMDFLRQATERIQQAK